MIWVGVIHIWLFLPTSCVRFTVVEVRLWVMIGFLINMMVNFALLLYPWGAFNNAFLLYEVCFQCLHYRRNPAWTYLHTQSVQSFKQNIQRKLLLWLATYVTFFGDKGSPVSCGFYCQVFHTVVSSNPVDSGLSEKPGCWERISSDTLWALKQSVWWEQICLWFAWTSGQLSCHLWWEPFSFLLLALDFLRMIFNKHVVSLVPSAVKLLNSTVEEILKNKNSLKSFTHAVPHVYDFHLWNRRTFSSVVSLSPYNAIW